MRNSGVRSIRPRKSARVSSTRIEKFPSFVVIQNIGQRKAYVEIAALYRMVRAKTYDALSDLA